MQTFTSIFFTLVLIGMLAVQVGVVVLAL